MITIGVIIAVLVLAYVIINSKDPIPVTDEEIAKCIGENSVLYVQLGCSHCKDQEDLFGEYLDNLKIIDCFYERDKCKGIAGTPTWKINGELIENVQSIKKLQELTGC